MSHFILPTLNAFLYCVIFMVVTVSCGIIYALFKWFCSDEEQQSNHPRNNGSYEGNGFSPVQTYPTDRVDAQQHEDIPLRPVYKPPSPVNAPAPYPSFQSNPPYPSASPSHSSQPPYPTQSTMPYPSQPSGMPMPYPTNLAPASNDDDRPPSYHDAMVQPSYNPYYKQN